MAMAESPGRDSVRLNDLDWKILQIMSDGKRYTQAYLYNDIDALEDQSADWVRQRVSHLFEAGLIEKVGTSSMYVISDLGEAALRIQDEIDEDISPRELSDMIREEARQSDRAGE